MVNKLLILTLGLLAAVHSQMPKISQNGCLVYKSNLYCAQCDQGNLYYQVGNGCVRFSGKACAAIDFNGNCINCQQGFYLAYGNTCKLVDFIVGCTLYGTDTSVTVCRTCASGYLLSQNQCLKTVPNCAQYISGTNICAQCATGFTQSSDWCSCVAGTIQNCVQYDCVGLCVQCNANFPRLAVGRNACLNFIQFCAVYNPSNNGCQTCFSGYVLSSDSNQCFPGIPFCTAYVSTAAAGTLRCSACLTNFYLSNNGLQCVNQIPNCQTYDNVNLVCSACVSGFQLTPAKGACFPPIANCVVYQPATHLNTQFYCQQCTSPYVPNQDNTYCMNTCANGFSLCAATNACVKVPSCCVFHDGCGQCLTVTPGYLWCQRQYCVEIPAECPNNVDSCGNCFCSNPAQSWCRVSKTCVTVPTCCKAHDGCGKCLTLNAGFLFCAATNQCVAIPSCPNYDSCGNCICLNGLTLCPTTNACFQAPVCCPTTSDNCGKCPNGSSVSTFTYCVATNTCVSKTTTCPAGADSCGNCVCPSGQVYCSSSNTCNTPLTCCLNNQVNSCGFCVNGFASGFGLCSLTGVCYAFPANCPTIGSHNCQTGACLCTQSNQSYCATTNSCVNIPSCCLTNNGCGSCLTTFSNTAFVNGVCFTQVNINFCLTYSANLQTCTVCQSGFILSFNQLTCYSPISGCSNYNSPLSTDTTAVCNTCFSPYFLSNNACTIPRCVITNTSGSLPTCTQCQFPTVVNSAATICGIAIQFCSTYNFNLPVSNNCAVCSFPYTLTTSNQCTSSSYLILQYGSGSNLVGSGSSIFGIQISNQALVFQAYTSNFANGGAFAFQWEIDPVNSGTSFSIRTQVLFVIPGNSVATNNYLYMTAGNNPNTVTAQVYSAQSNTNVAVLAQQWLFNKDASNNLAYNIQSAFNNLYLAYSLTLSSSPSQFLLG